jgi:hypothetical protein
MKNNNKNSKIRNNRNKALEYARVIAYIYVTGVGKKRESRPAALHVD